LCAAHKPRASQPRTRGDCDPDRELVLALGNDRQFATLREVLGSPEPGIHPRFAINAARVENRDALRAAPEERLITREAARRAAVLTELGVPPGVVNDIAAAFELAREAGGWPRPSASSATTARPSSSPAIRIGLSVTPSSYRSAPPRFPRRT
jgi:crotonobetainyl-CoA:carnitine CoA-transferase CaiB-like acyl-CoA transferase